MNPHKKEDLPDTKQDFRAWNEEMVRRYSPGHFHEKSHFLIRWIERRRVSVIMDILAQHSNKVKTMRNGMVLEVGCGSGNVLAALPSAFQPVGIDISTILIDESKERLRDRNALLVQADAESIPFQNSIFSHIICTEVLEHVLNPDIVIAEIARVATRDSSIIISVPNEKLIKWILHWLGPFLKFLHVGGSDEWHLHSFDLDYLRQKLHGKLKTEKIVPIVSWLLPVRYVVYCTVPSW